MTHGLTYKDVGVDYDPMDAFKRYAAYCALYTAGNATQRGVSQIPASRGESAFLTRVPGGIIGHVDEGLGTKNVVADDCVTEIANLLHVADHMPAPTSPHLFRNPHELYRSVPICTLAMIVNDMITVRVFPASVMMHLSVGSSEWFRNRQRAEEIAYGWMLGCQQAGCIWGGGETAVLKDIIYPDRFVLSGSAVGVPISEEDAHGPGIENGDVIVFLGGSGIHANGLTLARAVANRLADGYCTRISDGRSHGEALLAPTRIYTGFVEACLRERIRDNERIRIKYMVNMTGHGWRKLMHAEEPFTYVVDAPPISPLFSFIQEKGGISDREMYGTFNMGPGFALIVHPDDVEAVLRLQHRFNQPAWVGGHVVNGPQKSVWIRNRSIEFTADELQIR